MRQLFALLVRWSGLPILLREIIFRNRVTIVVYHDPSPERFELHLNYMVDRYNIIPLEQLVAAIEEQDWQKIPPKSLVITLDDGHRGNYALLDLIKKYKTPVTVYGCAGIINTRRHYWFLDCANQANQLKLLPNQVRLEHLKAANGFTPKKEFEVRQALSLDEILVMKRHNVDFQCHTLFHPILTNCSGEECWIEVEQAKQLLEELLEESILHFAYPNGNYREREIEYLRKAGYRSARTIEVGWNSLDTNIYALKSMVISDDAGLNEMIAQLCGVFPYSRYLRHGSSTGRRMTNEQNRSI